MYLITKSLIADFLRGSSEQPGLLSGLQQYPLVRGPGSTGQSPQLQLLQVTTKSQLLHVTTKSQLLQVRTKSQQLQVTTKSQLTQMTTKSQLLQVTTNLNDSCYTYN